MYSCNDPVHQCREHGRVHGFPIGTGGNIGTGYPGAGYDGCPRYHTNEWPNAGNTCTGHPYSKNCTASTALVPMRIHLHELQRRYGGISYGSGTGYFGCIKRCPGKQIEVAASLRHDIRMLKAGDILLK